MVRRVKVPTRNPFLTTDGVATRLAIRELKKAKIDPGSLLAKAGISLLKFGEEPKRVGAERSQAPCGQWSRMRLFNFCRTGRLKSRKLQAIWV